MGVERGRLRLSWTERGGPVAAEPARRAFGMRMLKQDLAGELGGAVDFDFATEGLTCVVEATLDP
jgi:hypothetical protein